MPFSKSIFRSLILTGAVLSLLSTSCFRKKKYENPITKETQQPDKVLFDKAIADIEHSRFEVARLTLNTLMNTYDTSEYLAKAKLAIADSWYREAGSHGLSQAEAEYKDFILFYPNMEESAEAQEKVCMIHYKQMEKADRDPKHAQRAEDECRLVLTQFPNSKFAPEANQKLREIQEVIAMHEFVVGDQYHHKGGRGFPAAANRLQALVDAYPLFSRSDEALWKLGDSYANMGPRFADKSAAAYARIVKDYPLSAYADVAKGKLEEMEKPIPQADPVAYARMKYEIENRTKPGIFSRATGLVSHSPDVSMAAKSGTPSVDGLRPTTPATVPVITPTPTGATGDIAIQATGNSTALDNNPDARANPPAAPAPSTTPAAGATAAAPAAGAATAATRAGSTPAATSTDKPAADGAAKTDDQSTTAKTTSKKKKKKKVTPPPTQ
jgi:outer membrane protein assembly factor BamD